jgi:hypothetical protein
MEALSPDDIESVNVFKGSSITDEVIARYGENARNGIVAIYTRAWAATGKKRFAPATTAVAGTRKPAAFVMDGSSATSVKGNANVQARENANTLTNVNVAAAGSPVTNVVSDNAAPATVDKVIIREAKSSQNTDKLP